MMCGGLMGGGFVSLGLAGGLFGLLFNIAILVGIVLLVIWAVQKFSRSTDSGSQAISPTSAGTGQTLLAREILDIRYARGELNREEYQTRLSDIS